MSSEKPEAVKKSTLKRNVKDLVFQELFSDKKNLLELYQSFFPEDKDVTVDQLTDRTITPIFLNMPHNDLAFLVDNKRLILVEAQSTWPKWIIRRTAAYLFRIYADYAEEGYRNNLSDKDVGIAAAECFILYSGPNKLPKVIHLSDFFAPGVTSGLDFSVNILRKENETIAGQYIAFCHIFDQQRDLEFKKGSKDPYKVLRETIRLCKERNILVNFWNTREVNFEVRLLDTETIEEMFSNLPSEMDELRDEVDELRDEIKAKEDTIKLKDDELREKDEELKEKNEDGINMLKQLVDAGHISLDLAKTMADQYKFPSKEL